MDLISRQAAIDAIEGIDWYMQNKSKDMVQGAHGTDDAWYKATDVYKALEELPSAQPSLLDALEIIDQFLHSCRDSLTCEIVTPNGMKLHTDWGYFSEGIDELRRYVEGEKDD